VVSLLIAGSVIGPGFLPAIADNDVGGILSYSVTDIDYGTGSFSALEEG